MHRIVCDVSTSKITQIDLTAEEIVELEALAVADELEILAAKLAANTPPALTKEELLAQLNALAAQIQALG
jgi:hypothetical protein